MDADESLKFPAHIFNDFRKFECQRSAVRIAQDQPRRTGTFCRLKRLNGILRTLFITVEEMFRVINDFASVRNEKSDRIFDEIEIFLFADLKRREYMEKP
jgi:hypothetical protein